MANPEHIQILKNSVRKWNNWRKENPEILPDLSDTNLSGMKLAHANLQDANLRWSFLQEADLQMANLQNANFERANISGANLRAANLQESNLRGANLAEAKLVSANLKNARLTDANLIGTNLKWVENLNSLQVNSSKSFDNKTQLPKNLKAKKMGANQWSCAEVDQGQ